MTQVKSLLTKKRSRRKKLLQKKYDLKASVQIHFTIVGISSDSQPEVLIFPKGASAAAWVGGAGVCNDCGVSLRVSLENANHVHCNSQVLKVLKLIIIMH